MHKYANENTFIAKIKIVIQHLLSPLKKIK